jgi:DNA-binding Lrp family transcriptional regulator
MARRRFTMRQMREIFRLKYECGLSARKIARVLKVSRSAVGEYLQAAERIGISWPIEEGVSESELQAKLFPPAGSPLERPPQKAIPDCERIHMELKRKGVTLALLWEEYLSANSGGYRYTQFCHYYREWAKSHDVTMRQMHINNRRDISRRQTHCITSEIVSAVQTHDPSGAYA